MLPKKCVSAISFMTLRGGSASDWMCVLHVRVLCALYVIHTWLKACSVAHVLAALACKCGLFAMWRALSECVCMCVCACVEYAQNILTLTPCCGCKAVVEGWNGSLNR